MATSNPRIEYLDEQTDDSDRSSATIHRRRKGGMFIILMLLLSFVMGGAGAFGTLFLISDNQALAHRLGIASLGVNTTETKKVILEESSAIIDAVTKVSPSVVSITTTKNVVDFFGQAAQQNGAGTGFILTNDGYIATNKHVASDKGTTYTVILNDGRNFDAKIVAVDPVNDLAILKIDASGLPTVELGDSDQLKVGQTVIAIGNALGQFQNTVTTGVLSAKDRQLSASGGDGQSVALENLLQTDAAINPGNSGGPLVNITGQVVGIDTAVASSAQGIGFAIPINVVKKAITSAEQTGTITRPSLGVRYIPITKDIAQLNQLSVDHGALVVRGQRAIELAVIPGSPADKAGIEENDIILEINGDQINEQHSLSGLIQKYTVGDTVKVKILHQGEEKTVDVKLDQLK